MEAESRLASLADHCSTRLDDAPEHLAVETPSMRMTNAQLLAASTSVRHRLRDAGLGQGDVAVLALPNGLSFAPVCLALLQESVTVVLLSANSGTEEIRAVLDAASPRCCIAPDAFARRSSGLFGQQRTLDIEFVDTSVRLLQNERVKEPATEIRQAALVKYTSGSLGRPKGILLHESHLVAEAKAVTETLQLTPEDRVLAGVPLTHSYAFDLGVLPMLQGNATLVLHESFVPPRTLRALADGSISVFLGVPGMYRFLVELPRKQELSPRLRHLLSCTAPLPPRLIARFHERFGRAICQHYGSSETGAVTLHHDREVLSRIESVGRAMAGVQIDVVDSAGQSMPPRETGEVVVGGPAVAAGYAPGSRPDPDPFSNGHFHTGDLGWMDEDGFLYLVGRKDDVINVGGLKVFPQEVVRVLEDMDQVREAAVVGLQNDRGESSVHAAVTVRTPIAEENILDHCRGRLADYKVPRRVEIRGELPRTSGGKIRLTAGDIDS